MLHAARAPDAWPIAMTIAGSDSGGGAGIQADLKTFAALGVYGTSVVTAVTAQNTLGVQGFAALAPQFVALQFSTVCTDISIAAVKTGMLANAAIVQAVVASLQAGPAVPIVVDPVTHAKRGDALIEPEGVCAVRDVLLPLATVVTPNLAEASALTGIAVVNDDDMRRAGERLLELGCHAAIVKGGHRAGDACDLFVDGSRSEWLCAERIDTRCTHGTGCTFSAAITAYLARGYELLTAARLAKRYLTKALRAGYVIGAGSSPVNHFYAHAAK